MDVPWWSFRSVQGTTSATAAHRDEIGKEPPCTRKRVSSPDRSGPVLEKWALSCQQGQTTHTGPPPDHPSGTSPNTIGWEVPHLDRGGAAHHPEAAPDAERKQTRGMNRQQPSQIREQPPPSNHGRVGRSRARGIRFGRPPPRQPFRDLGPQLTLRRPCPGEGRPVTRTPSRRRCRPW